MLSLAVTPPRVQTTGATNIVQAGLSRGFSASGQSKAATGAARQTAPSRADPTRAEGPKTRERSESEREAITNLKLTGRRRENKATRNERSRVVQHERTCDLDHSEKAGGEEAAARATNSQIKTCPATEQAHQLSAQPRGHAADMKASTTGAWVVPGGGEWTRRYAIFFKREGVFLSWPTATRSGARVRN